MSVRYCNKMNMNIKRVFDLIRSRKMIKKKEIFTFLELDKVNILEAGAYKGEDTVEMATMLPRSSIYAFEPVPENYNDLVINTSAVKNVKTFNMALGENTGTDKIHISNDTMNSGVSASSSLLEPKEHLKFHQNITFPKSIEVKVTTIDEWALHNNIDHIDFMWLDMQGAEYLALKASPRILSTVNVLYTEVSLKQMYEGAPLYKEYKSWLNSIGFEVVKESLPWKDMGNVLFVRK